MSIRGGARRPPTFKSRGNRQYPSELLKAAGIREVVVFHSAAPELRKYLDEFPFDVIADPDRALYREFGVGEGHFGRPADLLVAPSGLIVAAKYGTHTDDQWSVDDLLALASAH